MKYTPFHEQQFRQSVNDAMKTIRTILNNERNPILAGDDMKHYYKDKYALAEFLTNTSIAAEMNVFTALGLEPDQQTKVLSWVHEKKLSVALRFLVEDTCMFLKEEDVEIFADRDIVQQTTTTTANIKDRQGGGIFGATTTGNKEKEEIITTHRVVQRIKELHWKIGVRYKILIYPGRNPENGILMQQRSTETVLITQAGVGNNQTTGRRKGPLPERTLHPPVETDMTWFFKNIGPEEKNCQFTIKRDVAKTPRRNNDIDIAIDAHKKIYDWSRITQGFFLQRIEKEILGKDNPVHGHNKKPTTTTSTPPQQQVILPVILKPGTTGIMQGLLKEPSFNGKRIRIVEYFPDQQRYKAEPIDNEHSGLPPTLSIKPANILPDNNNEIIVQQSQQQTSTTSSPPLSTISDNEKIFCPIVPLMENGTILPMSDISDFLQEQTKSIDNTIDNLSRIYPPKQLIKLVSVAEASIVVLCKHLEHLAIQYHDSLDYIEDMLKQQLIHAIGKEIHRNDFEQFIKFYQTTKFYNTYYTPKPFSHSIRKLGHYPDGIISIESTNNIINNSSSSMLGTNATTTEPILTWVRSISGNDAPSIYIPIDSATEMEITGDRYIHGWMQHRFKLERPKPEYNLICRARQFSSYLIILGTVVGPNRFDPKDAIILQNKDEVLIPLITNVLPSAKEFKDAIQSLSPEQQNFAKAYWSMQLESSVFGVCIVQIKPQLEQLLNLPDNSLTKEIQLTQDLMSLFIDYQVPSDLMTYDDDGDNASTVTEKINTVKGHVKSVMDVINESKKRQLKEEEMKADMRAEMEYKPPTQPLVVPEAADGHSLNAALNESSETSSQQQRRGGGMRRRLLKNNAPQPTSVTVRQQHQMVSTSNLLYNEPPPPPPAQQQQQQSSPTRGNKEQYITTNQNFKPQKGDLGGDGGDNNNNNNVSNNGTSGEDFTLIPKILDSRLETLDNDNALRSTIIKAGSNWTRNRQENFLTGSKISSLGPDDIATERKKAFDLLDAISRSGTLPINCAELHVFVAMSHCFDNDVMGTVIQDNINPIEKVEKSSLLLASTIHSQPPEKLIKSDENIQRLKNSYPLLFTNNENEAIEQG